MVSGFGVRAWFFQLKGRDQKTTLLLPSPFASWTMAWYMRSKVTAGMPQMTASIARRSIVRWARFSGENTGAVVAGFAVSGALFSQPARASAIVAASADLLVMEISVGTRRLPLATIFVLLWRQRYSNPIGPGSCALRGSRHVAKRDQLNMNPG